MEETGSPEGLHEFGAEPGPEAGLEAGAEAAAGTAPTAGSDAGSAAGSEAGLADIAGSASAPAAVPDAAPGLLGQVMDLAGAGGPVLLILLALSLIGVTLVLIKAGQLVRLRLWDRRPIRAALAAWSAGRRQEAVAALEGVPHPVAGPLAHAMAETARGETPEALIREEVERRSEAVLEDLRSQQRPLEIIAGISPLLGLLGTVLGMIEAFRQLERAGAAADPAILSGGIWEALLTTAAGLAIAVPAVIAVQVLDRIVDRVRHALGDAATRVFTLEGRRTGSMAADAATPAAKGVDRAA